MILSYSQYRHLQTLYQRAVLEKSKLVEIFVKSDDFCKSLVQRQVSEHSQNNTFIDKTGQLSTAEMMSIVIFYHHSGIRCFSGYYKHVLAVHFSADFPDLCSYNRFVQKMPRLAFILYAFLFLACLSPATEANYIDATKLVVCHNKRIFNHQVFQGFASRGKSSTGWFYGFKIHAIVNQEGDLVHCQFTTGKVADNDQDLLRTMANYFQGKVYGDKGYIAAIKGELKDKGLDIISKVRKNMKKQKISQKEAYYLRHRGRIESCFERMKAFCNMEHSRHRSTKNLIVNLLAGLIAYTFLDKKPSIQEYQEITQIEDLKIW